MPVEPIWAEDSSANPYAPKPKNAMKPRSSSPAQPTTMFSPTASSAITSASMPTWSWKPPRPSDGSTTPISPATASRGHQPSRSPARWAWPSQDGRYSRRPVRLATHSSTPSRGPRVPCGLSRMSGGSWESGGPCGSTLIGASHLLKLRLAEQPARPREHHGDQQPEHDQVGVRGGDVAGHERLREADEQAAEHRSRDRAYPADHGRGERLESGDEPDRVRHLVEQQPGHDPGHAREGRAEEERGRDGEVHVDPQHLGRLPVGRYRPHLLAQPGPVDRQPQADHQRA